MTVLGDNTRIPLLGAGRSYFHLRDLRTRDQSARIPLITHGRSVKIEDLDTLSGHARIPTLDGSFFSPTELLAATAPVLTLDTVPGGDMGSTVAITGTWVYAIPTTITAVWTAGAEVGAITNFAADDDGTWSATVGTPVAAGTYTLVVTGTGPNTDSSPASAGVVIVDPGP